MVKRYLQEKRGWIRIVEAFVAVLLITGIVLMLVDNGVLSEDSSRAIYEIEDTILTMVQQNQTLRTEILSFVALPVNDSAFSANLQNTISQNIPNYLDCSAMVCALGEGECVIDMGVNASVYSRAVVISSDLTSFDPRQLKLFCYKK